LIVVDTSAWVEDLRGTGSPANMALKRALSAEGELGVVHVVRMELLAGAGNDEQVGTAPRLLARGIALPTSSPGTTSTWRACTGPPVVPVRRSAR
jgi:hypothetical protein